MEWGSSVNVDTGFLLSGEVNLPVPVDLKFMSYWNVEKPQFAANWSMQFTVKFLIPKSGGG
jgi:hypothetical protein